MSKGYHQRNGPDFYGIELRQSYFPSHLANRILFQDNVNLVTLEGRIVDISLLRTVRVAVHSPLPWTFDCIPATLRGKGYFAAINT